MIYGSMKVLPQLFLIMLALKEDRLLKSSKMNHGCILLIIKDGGYPMI
jgi:hypothetical protein